MQGFTFHSPTKVIFGRDAELSAADEIKRCGGTRVMLVHGGGSAVASGLIGRLLKVLEEAGLPHTALSGVQPNPRLTLAREGVRQALDFKADFILAAGGGSVIDTAKAIAHGIANPGIDIWKFWTREEPLTCSAPVGAIPTIPAAGSETSDSAVITNDTEGLKRGLTTQFNRPRFAAMNPELLCTLPKYQIACSVVDILMHTLDRYFTPTDGNATTDALAEALLGVVIANGEKAMHNPHDYEAMSELMWCGSLSHNGITGLGAAMDFAVHQLGHELSGMFDVAHGASLSAVWGAWARYVCPVKPGRFARYAERVWGIYESDAERAAEAGIARTVSYFSGLGMPTSLSELGIGVQDDGTLLRLADSCVFHGKRTIGQFRVLGAQDVYRIYCAANR